MMNTLTAINGFEFSYVNPPPGSQLSRSDSAFTRSASITGSTAAAVRAPKDNMNVAFAIDRLSKRVGDDQWQATLPVPFGIQRITMDRCSTLTTSQMWVLKVHSNNLFYCVRLMFSQVVLC
jgi:predicted RNA methylase